jgi:hypothetical protein
VAGAVRHVRPAEQQRGAVPPQYGVDVPGVGPDGLYHAAAAAGCLVDEEHATRHKRADGRDKAEHDAEEDAAVPRRLGKEGNLGHQGAGVVDEEVLRRRKGFVHGVDGPVDPQNATPDVRSHEAFEDILVF